jgi:hypothetical protein
MFALPREEFVPEDKRPLAYLDLDLDVTEGCAAKRFLIKPMLTAKLLQAAEILEGDNVLIVGAATGYAAAVAARLAAKVTATESDAALVAKGRDILGKLGLTAKVTFQVAEPAAGGRSGQTLQADERGRPAARGFRHKAAITCYDCKACTRRFRDPAAVRRICAHLAGTRASSRVRFLDPLFTRS